MARPVRNCRPTNPAMFRDNEGSKRRDLSGECFPYTCLADPGGRRLFVSLWNKASVAVIDLADHKVTATWPTERHPTEMALSPDGRTLYVSCANSTKVSVLDARDGKPLETIACALYPAAPSGNTPNSLSLTPDGQMLFVANADANNVAVFNVAEPGEAKPLGFIPAGWYPTSVRYNAADKKLYVANGKGHARRSQSAGANPVFGADRADRRVHRRPVSRHPEHHRHADAERRWPDTASRPMRAVRCERTPAQSAIWPAGNPIPAKVGDASPIKHCIYIIKENRTYDQVFGDMKEGNGDPSCAFSPRRSRPIITTWPANSCCWTTSTSTAKCRPTATNGRWGPMPPTSWRNLAADLSRQSAKKLGISVRGQLRLHRPSGRRLPVGPLRRGRRQLSQLRRMGRQRQDARRPGAGRASRRWRDTSTR